MSLTTEIETLEKHLNGLANDAEAELMNHYALWGLPAAPRRFGRLRSLASRMAHWLRPYRAEHPDSWPPGLKHGARTAAARPLLIWAVGADRRALASACRALSELLDEFPGLAPILVTDVADFASFSRLGWMVEYLPRLSGSGKPYDERKARFLARLYRGAPALPVRLGLHSESHADDIREWLSTHVTENGRSGAGRRAYSTDSAAA